MARVRARGGCGQPLNTFSPRKCEPSLGSGEEMRARWGAGGGGGESAGGCPGGVWAVGVVRARGGVGTHCGSL